MGNIISKEITDVYCKKPATITIPHQVQACILRTSNVCEKYELTTEYTDNSQYLRVSKGNKCPKEFDQIN